MKLIAATPAQMQWICPRAKCSLSPGAHALAAVDKNGRIRGMVAYDNFGPASCNVHMAIETPIAWRTLIPKCFAIAFDGWKLTVGLAVICSANTRSLRMARHLGFKEVHRTKDGWGPGVDLVHHELRRDDCAHLWPLQRKAA